MTYTKATTTTTTTYTKSCITKLYFLILKLHFFFTRCYVKVNCKIMPHFHWTFSQIPVYSRKTLKEVSCWHWGSSTTSQVLQTWTNNPGPRDKWKTSCGDGLCLAYRPKPLIKCRVSPLWWLCGFHLAGRSETLVPHSDAVGGSLASLRVCLLGVCRLSFKWKWIIIMG